MSRYLTMILIFVVLTTQSVWAMHANEAVQHSGNGETVLKLDSDSSTSKFESCDHLCHAAAHLIGLLAATPDEFSNVIHLQKIAPCGLNTLFKYQPSVPPPIS